MEEDKDDIHKSKWGMESWTFGKIKKRMGKCMLFH